MLMEAQIFAMKTQGKPLKQPKGFPVAAEVTRLKLWRQADVSAGSEPRYLGCYEGN